MFDAQTVYFSEVDRIEWDGSNFRIYLFVKRGGALEPAEAELLCPPPALPDLILKFLCALTAAGIAAVKVPFSELLMH